MGPLRKLKDVPERYTGKIGERSTKRKLTNFFFASDHAEALNNLGNDLKNAIELFQVSFDLLCYSLSCLIRFQMSRLR